MKLWKLLMYCQLLLFLFETGEALTKSFLLATSYTGKFLP